MTKILKTYFENNQEIFVCPECKNDVISDSYTGDSICNSCGLVVSEKSLDISNFEKNMFSHEAIRDKARTGVINLLFSPKPYFNTMIRKYDTKNKEFNRIAVLDTYNHDSDVKNLLIAIRHLKLISAKLRLTYQVKSHAIFIYRKALKKNLIRGRSIDGMICACIYFACRMFKIPIAFKEIVNESGMKGKNIRNCYMTLIKELNLKVIPLTPDIFVSKYINKLKLSPDVERKVLFILSFLKQYMMGRDPKVICAGLIYLVCKRNKITLVQKKIAEIIGTTEVSLRYTYKQMEDYLSKKQINVKLEC